MNRRDEHRLRDIVAAAEAIASHLTRSGLDDGLVFDAVCMRLTEIGEAVAALDPQLLAREPTVRWAGAKGMRNHLAHRYFDTTHAIVAETVAHNLPPLVAAVRRLLAEIEQR